MDVMDGLCPGGPPGGRKWFNVTVQVSHVTQSRGHLVVIKMRGIMRIFVLAAHIVSLDKSIRTR